MIPKYILYHIFNFIQDKPTIRNFLTIKKSYYQDLKKILYKKIINKELIYLDVTIYNSDLELFKQYPFSYEINYNLIHKLDIMMFRSIGIFIDKNIVEKNSERQILSFLTDNLKYISRSSFMECFEFSMEKKYHSVVSYMYNNQGIIGINIRSYKTKYKKFIQYICYNQLLKSYNNYGFIKLDFKLDLETCKYLTKTMSADIILFNLLILNYHYPVIDFLFENFEIKYLRIAELLYIKKEYPHFIIKIYENNGNFDLNSQLSIAKHYKCNEVINFLIKKGAVDTGEHYYFNEKLFFVI